MSATAILVVNGFDRDDHWGPYDAAEAARYPWIELCLRQIARHTAPAGHHVHVYDNARLASQRAAMARHPHVTVAPRDATIRAAAALGRFAPRVERRLDRKHWPALELLVRRLPRDCERFVTLDSDALPIRDGWLDELNGRLDDGATIVGVWRDEMAPEVDPFVHVSCLAMRRAEFARLGVSFGEGRDVAQGLTRAVLDAGGRVDELRSSNAHDPHFLLGGVYGDLVYHQGAGGRHARFWKQTAGEDEERIRGELRDAAFSDLDGLIERLTGHPYGAARVPAPGPTTP